MSAARHEFGRSLIAAAPTLLVSFTSSPCTEDVPGIDTPLATAAGEFPEVGLVRVADGVDLEYRDWGGEGSPIVLLGGLGNSAAVFDDLAALDALGIDRALLVGHSIAGDELTGIARSPPDVPIGLVHLDAAFDRTDPAIGAIGAIGDCLPLAPTVDRSVAGTGISEGTSTVGPDYTGIDVPVTALIGDDADPAAAFPLSALATPDVRESLRDCAGRIAEFKRVAGADPLRAANPCRRPGSRSSPVGPTTSSSSSPTW